MSVDFSHVGRTSAVRTGSGDPWPDSAGGSGSGWLLALLSRANYGFWPVGVSLCCSCSRQDQGGLQNLPSASSLDGCPIHEHLARLNVSGKASGSPL